MLNDVNNWKFLSNLKNYKSNPLILKLLTETTEIHKANTLKDENAIQW